MRSRNDDARGATPEDLAGARDRLRVRWLTAIAGLLSGLAAFGIGEAVYNRIPAKRVMLNTMGTVAPAVTGENYSLAVVKNGALAGAVLGLCLGGTLGLAGGLSRRSWPAMWGAALLGSTLGAGMAGGIALGSLPYFAEAKITRPEHDLLLSMMMHGLTWGPAGAAGGLAFAVGLGWRSWKGIVHAVLAGLAGAVLGAFAFDLLGGVIFPLAEAGSPVSTTWPSRLVARLWVTAATAACILQVLPETSTASPGVIPAEAPDSPRKKSRRRRS